MQNRSGNLGGMHVKHLFEDGGIYMERESTSDYVENFLEKLRANKEYKYWAIESDEDEDTDEPDIAYDDISRFGSAESCPDWPEERRTIVGTDLHLPTFDESYEEESYEVSCTKYLIVTYANFRFKTQSVTKKWLHEEVPMIVWMNEPLHKELAHAGLAV